ncbi:hypothetical protein [Methanobacterium lacus]|nr:hypothetical protein [Methanobacterium lacus]
MLALITSIGGIEGVSATNPCETHIGTNESFSYAHNVYMRNQADGQYVIYQKPKGYNNTKWIKYLFYRVQDDSRLLDTYKLVEIQNVTLVNNNLYSVNFPRTSVASVMAGTTSEEMGRGFESHVILISDDGSDIGVNSGTILSSINFYHESNSFTPNGDLSGLAKLQIIIKNNLYQGSMIAGNSTTTYTWNGETCTIATVDKWTKVLSDTEIASGKLAVLHGAASTMSPDDNGGVFNRDPSNKIYAHPGVNSTIIGESGGNVIGYGWFSDVTTEGWTLALYEHYDVAVNTVMSFLYTITAYVTG